MDHYLVTAIIRLKMVESWVECEYTAIWDLLEDEPEEFIKEATYVWRRWKRV